MSRLMPEVAPEHGEREAAHAGLHAEVDRLRPQAGPGRLRRRAGEHAADGDTTLGVNHQAQGEFTSGSSATSRTSFTPDQPAIHVVKAGPRRRTPGDTLTFGYTVTNPGTVPLTNVTATDDKCSPLTRTGNTADTTLDPGDVWTYTCSYVIQWSPGDANPVVNTVTTCGMPPGGGPPGGPSQVCDTDQHSTTLVPPGTTTPPETPAQTAGRLPSQPPQIAVSPARVQPGSARLSGPAAAPPPARWRRP